MNKPAPFLFLSFVFLITFSLLLSTLSVKHAAGQWTHLDYGDYLSDFIGTVGDVDTFTFLGNFGDVVMVRMSEAHVGLKPGIWLYEAGDSLLQYKWGIYYASIVDEILSDTGTFVIHCADSGSATGGYRLKLLCRNQVQASGMQVYYGDTLRSYLYPGDIGAYRFWGDSGDVVMIRMAEVTAALRPDLSVYKPDNTQLDAISGDKYALLEHRLVHWGMYTFYCDEVLADDGGYYRVKLLCRNAVRDSGRLISYGKTIVDTLYLGDVKGYRFIGEMGDTVTIRMAEEAELEGDFDPLVSLYGLEDTLLQTEGDTTLASIDNYVLDSSGTYTVYCDDQGVDGSGEYVLELLCWNTIPDSARPISCGELVPETLSLGQIDTYCFDGDSGDVVMIRMAEVSTSLQPKVSLYRPDHTLLDSISDNECASLGDVTLLTAGTYTIFCDDRGSNDSGEYRLKLLCRNKDGMEIPYGYWDRTMLKLGDIDAYRFEGEAGDVVMIRMLDAEVTRPLQPIISLYGPDSDSLATDYADGDHCAYIVDYILPTDGTYAVFCDDEKGNDSGDYCIKLLCRNYEQNNAERIPYGDSLEGFLQLGDINAYTFEGEIGDTVFVSMEEKTGDFEPWISLYNPDNQFLDTDSNSDFASLEAESLEVDGIYTIYCDDSPGNDSGTYLLKLSSPNAGPINISYGDLVYGDLASGDTNLYSFNGEAGDKVIIRLLTDWEGQVRLELFDSLGTLVIFDTNYWRADIVDAILPYDGFYTIFVMGGGNWSYSLSLQCRQHVKDHGDTIECEAQVNSSVSPRGDMDAYLFWGDIGDIVTIELQELSGDLGYRPWLELFDPDDNLIDQDTDEMLAYIANLALGDSGYFTIFVSDTAGEDTGSYQLSLECQHQQQADTIDYDSYLEAFITPEGDTDAYVFDADSGDKVIIHMMGVWESYPKLELFNPGGSLIREVYNYWRADIVDLVLHDSGHHTILVSDEEGNDTGSYWLSLQCRQHVKAHGDTIDYDTLVISSITPRGDMDAYLFLGNIGDTVTIELQELSGDLGYRPWLELFDPHDTLIQEHRDTSRAFLANLVLEEAGYYTIFASDEEGEDTGSYVLSLECQHQQQADTIDYDTLVISSLTSQDPVDAYVFWGEAEDKVIIRLLADWGDSARLELFDSWGILVTQDADSGRADISDAILHDDGFYTIFVAGEGTGNYSLSLQCRQQVKLRGDTIACDTSVISSITPRGDLDAYLFWGNSGDTVYIEMLGEDWAYYPKLELFDPEDILIGENHDSWSAELSDFAIHSSGYHTIFASDEAGEDTGSYRLTLEYRQQHADTIGYDTLVTSSITSGRDIDAYVFWGDAGDKVIIRLLRDSGFSPKLELFDPEDSLIREEYDTWRADIEDFALPDFGFYTICVSDNWGEGTGSYSMSLQCRQDVKDHGDTIDYDTLVTSSISPRGDMDAYIYLGDIGDTITIELLELSGDEGFRPKLELFDPGDNLIDEDHNSSRADISDLVLDDFGYYTIFTSDEAGEDEGSYSLSLEVATMDTTPPTFDHSITSDNIIAIDQIVMGTFSEPVREATVNSSSFFLESTKTGTRIDGEIKYDSLEIILRFTPTGCYLPCDSSQCFPPDDIINATLTDSIKDLAGNSLEYTEWNFDTRPGVYPGDTNNDGEVNEVDVLPLGVFWLHTSTQRDSTTIDWRIMPVRESWGTLAAMYADADGNGTVELKDLDAISSNWGKTHLYPDPVFSPGDLDSLSSDNPYMETFEELYQDLKDEGSEGGDRIREILETILTSPDNPLRFTLSQNFPNPFNPETEIRYFLPQDARVELVIYNILGERVKTLVNRFQTAGPKSIHWDGTSDSGKSVASGIYFCRLKAGEFEACNKMLLLR